MRTYAALACLFLLAGPRIEAQDTFSIVAVDTITDEVGSAGASCVDLFAFGITDIGFLGDLLPGLGAINTQAAYNDINQANARTRMLAGDTPAQLIAWLQANDAQGVADANNRQYGVAELIGSGAQTAAHTGSMCLDHAGHRIGPNYAIQGNILLGPQILDSMEARFLGTSGSLAQKLMSALQGANVVGADNRCDDNNSSSLFAFLKVSSPTDPDGEPYLDLGVRTHDGAGLEPIDSLQILFGQWVGFDDLGSQPAMSVAPNPATTQLVLFLHNSETLNGPIEVCDAAGRWVPVKVTVQGSIVRVDIANLDAGLYHVHRTMRGGARMHARFIKE